MLMFVDDIIACFLLQEPAQQDQPGSPVSDAMMEDRAYIDHPCWCSFHLRTRLQLGEEDAVISDDEEEVGFHLGEVRASETGVAARREGTGLACERTSFRLPLCIFHQFSLSPANVKVAGANRSGPPLPTVPCAQRAPDCFMLVAGVPAWLTDAELRKHSGQFGQVRNLRIMVDLSTGKSAGVVLVEYTEPEAVKKATRVDGICRLRILQGFGIVPRAMQVGALSAKLVTHTTCPGPSKGKRRLVGMIWQMKRGKRRATLNQAPP